VVRDILVDNFAKPHDMALVEIEMIQEENTIYANLLSKGSRWMMVDYPYEFKTITRYVVENNKIVSIQNFFDSFEFMRLFGQALIIQKDEFKIKEYVNLLVDLGMLPQERGKPQK
jgi:hypothetical protein